jgi:hypothetical protein
LEHWIEKNIFRRLFKVPVGRLDWQQTDGLFCWTGLVVNLDIDTD